MASNNGNVSTVWPHRLKELRLREGLSLRSMAKRMRIPMSKVAAQEEGRTDLLVSDLYRWQAALRVPLSELLESRVTGLTEDVRQRACLVRLTKTAKALVGKCPTDRESRLAQQIVDQLYELMPELEQVTAWPEGRPRSLSDLGRAADEISMTEWMLPEYD